MICALTTFNFMLLSLHVLQLREMPGNGARRSMTVRVGEEQSVATLDQSMPQTSQQFFSSSQCLSSVLGCLREGCCHPRPVHVTWLGVCIGIGIGIGCFNDRSSLCLCLGCFQGLSSVLLGCYQGDKEGWRGHFVIVVHASFTFTPQWLLNNNSSSCCCLSLILHFLSKNGSRSKCMIELLWFTFRVSSHNSLYASLSHPITLSMPQCRPLSGGDAPHWMHDKYQFKAK